MAKPIGDEVITTDDWIAKNYDNLPLYMGGMLKVDPSATVVADEKVLKPTDVAIKNPNVLMFSVDLPPTASYDAGSRIDLSVTVIGGKPPYKYQWRKTGNPIAGKTDSDYLLTDNASKAHEGVYSCQVTDQVGNVITSQGVNITIKVKTVTAKTGITKPAGSVIPAADLFTFSTATSTALAASAADVTGVTGTGATWDNTKKELTLTAAASATPLALTFTVGAGVVRSPTSGALAITVS